MSATEPIDFANINCVFLDRDGVLNQKPPEGTYVTRVEGFVVLPQVEEAVAALNRSGRKVIVVTNQRGIALGLYTRQDLDRMHTLLQKRLGDRGAHLDAIYVCPHDEGQCDCRKPLTGLFEQAFRDFPELTAGHSLMVGDSLRDIEAGRAAGMATVLTTGSSTARDQFASRLSDMTVQTLPELVFLHLCPR